MQREADRGRRARRCRAARIRVGGFVVGGREASMKRSNAGLEAAAHGAVVVRAGGNRRSPRSGRGRGARSAARCDRRPRARENRRRDRRGGFSRRPGRPGADGRRRAGCGPASMSARKSARAGEQVGRVVGKLQQRLRVHRRPGRRGPSRSIAARASRDRLQSQIVRAARGVFAEGFGQVGRSYRRARTRAPLPDSDRAW